VIKQKTLKRLNLKRVEETINARGTLVGKSMEDRNEGGKY
jgi:hypothetical protein